MGEHSNLIQTVRVINWGSIYLLVLIATVVALPSLNFGWIRNTVRRRSRGARLQRLYPKAVNIASRLQDATNIGYKFFPPSRPNMVALEAETWSLYLELNKLGIAVPASDRAVQNKDGDEFYSLHATFLDNILPYMEKANLNEAQGVARTGIAQGVWKSASKL